MGVFLAVGVDLDERLDDLTAPVAVRA